MAYMRAKACRHRAVNTNGDTRTLLDIPRYDFNWQLLYRYSQPVKLSKGDSIKFTACHNDTVANNPAIPDSTRNVRWGMQTN